MHILNTNHDRGGLLRLLDCERATACRKIHLNSVALFDLYQYVVAVPSTTHNRHPIVLHAHLLSRIYHKKPPTKTCLLPIQSPLGIPDTRESSASRLSRFRYCQGYPLLQFTTFSCTTDHRNIKLATMVGSNRSLGICLSSCSSTCTLHLPDSSQEESNWLRSSRLGLLTRQSGNDHVVNRLQTEPKGTDEEEQKNRIAGKIADVAPKLP
ncbi:hypothetical protein BJ170DRAFT_88453 [Xylariales sp. AK1849]|nr:hypothetical protein BJ170DRAFT_88453 [Xylariales sp. AK1849]